ncbi:hypothetical protein TCE0_044r17390 [Talaromyces pinophilus]|uniref:Uncharacterized protein n=1 Tax=Talaromyces pinophilus TaxID=128442 RepID=A0A478ECX5_TALPI|nr:hypothetical protein TCE0_044r17390 [Talaromyces pinophilus]
MSRSYKEIPMFDGAITLRIDTTPLSLDEETRALYNRAIADPTSLTDPERRRITHRPPPDEEDALCRQACGSSMTELVAKAIAIHNNGSATGTSTGTEDLVLTYKEAHHITAGVVPGQPGRLLSYRARLSKEEQDLTHKAAAAALTEEMKVAQEVARAVHRRWWPAQKAATESLNDDDSRNIRYAMRIPWQDQILKSASRDGSPSVSGLVVFYDPERTEEHKSEVEQAVFNGMHYQPMSMDDRAIARFSLHWMEVPALYSDDTDKLSALQAKFQTMLANHEFPTGLRTDCFLYMDKEGICFTRPYVWLGEPVPSNIEPGPAPDTEKATTESGVGKKEEIVPLKVDIKHIAPTLFARLVQRDLSGKEKRWPYRHTSELAMLHQAARHSRNSQGEPDGIWPPPSRFM